MNDAAASVLLCVIRVGPQDYVVDLARVDEILAVPTLTPLPRAPAFLEGVVQLHDDVLPVVDVRKRLNVPPGSGLALTPSGRPKSRERLLVCRIGRRKVGLIVDAVTQTMRVSRVSLKPAPIALAHGHVLGVCGEGQELKLMLDVVGLFSEDTP